MLRRIVLRLRALSTPVTECGYRNSASADPSATVEYPSNWALPSSTPSVFTGVPANFLSAAEKIVPKPPSLIGIAMIATRITT